MGGLFVYLSQRLASVVKNSIFLLTIRCTYPPTLSSFSFAPARFGIATRYDLNPTTALIVCSNNT